MPDLLSLPRELRDEIYELMFRSSLTLKKAHLPRIRLARKKVTSPEITGSDPGDYKKLEAMPGESNITHLKDPDFYTGEEAIRYPIAEPVPPTDPLLYVNQQIRAEMQETIQKKSINWRVRLAFREDKELLYPTWLSMPAFTNRIDNLDVEIRIRKKKTASLFSTTSSIASTNSSRNDSRNNQGDVFYGGFALLQRLLERGPSFVHKKKTAEAPNVPTTIGCVTIQIIPKELAYCRDANELMEECISWLDHLLTDSEDPDYSDPEKKDVWQTLDEFLHFFAERIERFAFQVEDMRREWVMKDAMAERDERTRGRREKERKEFEERKKEREERMRTQEELTFAEGNADGVTISCDRGIDFGAAKGTII